MQNIWFQISTWPIIIERSRETDSSKVLNDWYAIAWCCNKVWYEILYPFPNLNGCTVEVWAWISTSIPKFTGYTFTYQYWDFSYTMLVNGADLPHVTKRGPGNFRYSTAALEGPLADNSLSQWVGRVSGVLRRDCPRSKPAALCFIEVTATEVSCASCKPKFLNCSVYSTTELKWYLRNRRWVINS